MTDDSLTLLDQILADAAALGADAADAVLFRSRSTSLSVRLGAVEDVASSESSDIGLRVFIGRRQAVVSSSDLRRETLGDLAGRVIAMAKEAPEDAYAGLAPEDRILRAAPADLDLYDDHEVDMETLKHMCLEAEDAARGVKGVTNSEGAGAGASSGRIALATSHGFRGTYQSSSFSLSASVIAGTGAGMERDYDYTSTRHFDDMAAAGDIGRGAGERAVKRLDPRKVETGSVPVVFDPRTGNSLLGHFAGAINGQGIARGTSFLKDAMGSAVFAPGVTIIDDPTRVRGLKSKPFDGEGVASGPLTLVEDGELQCWILDSTSARQLELETNGRAARGTATPPGPSTTNLYLAPGNGSPKDMIGGIDNGFYVTELIGMGVNGVTGDYSRGASGFWIVNGELAYPVSELTIAGTLQDIFAGITPADDLTFRYGVNVPTLRVDGMMIAGA